MSQKYVMKWISVKEELPFNNETVLITTKSGLVQIGYCYENVWYSIIGVLATNLVPIDVIAWMRLPDAYREEK